ncbi:MAG: hypothetical protein OXQ89_20205 [Rhodospirillaceae bacterium]|nr:hypothetical protein [Rhodospirillaceae bacterium]MDE0361313.1 hypothetical protein [Rhodospirillaceae bacterium]
MNEPIRESDAPVALAGALALPAYSLRRGRRFSNRVKFNRRLGKGRSPDRRGGLHCRVRRRHALDRAG